MTSTLPPLWKVTGTSKGQPATVRLRAVDYDEAVKIASQRRVVVHNVCQVDEDLELSRRLAQKTMRGVLAKRNRRPKLLTQQADHLRWIREEHKARKYQG